MPWILLPDGPADRCCGSYSNDDNCKGVERPELKGLTTFSYRTKPVYTGDSNPPPHDQDLCALTKELASQFLVCLDRLFYIALSSSSLV